MKKQIKIYNQRYTIEFVPQKDIHKFLDPDNKIKDKYYWGACNSMTNQIFVAEELHEDKKIPILVHELTHAILNDTGYVDRKFTVEEVCNITESNIIEITRIVKLFESKPKSKKKETSK